MKDSLPKLPNEMPNTDEPERIAAALIVAAPPGCEPARGYFQLKPVWFVDFFRGRPA